MLKLRTKIIWIAVSVAIFAGVWTGVFIQDRAKTAQRGKSLLQNLEKNYALTLPKNVTCKRIISDGFVGYNAYAYYEINDKDFTWKNGTGDEWNGADSFGVAFQKHFSFLMHGCEPDFSKEYQYSYYAKERTWTYIMYIEEDNALAVGISVD